MLLLLVLRINLKKVMKTVHEKNKIRTLHLFPCSHLIDYGRANMMHFTKININL